ncbi:MAG TPA: hypothetical protein VMZ33_08265 [Candidatus Limnocylindrales bacterium]|nr:hypothetical protein [Candidatus Limnocylindrales bacterium]
MFVVTTDLDEPYVPFVTGRHSSGRMHEVRRRESRAGTPRRLVGKALIRAGLAVAGLDGSSSR